MSNLNSRLNAIEKRLQTAISFQKKAEADEAALAYLDDWHWLKSVCAGQPGFDADGLLLPDPPAEPTTTVETWTEQEERERRAGDDEVPVI